MAKIPAGTVDRMREAIMQLDTAEVRHAYATGNYPRAERTKDVNTRYRWDLFHAARSRGLIPWDLFDEIDGVNDAHIDTALRGIVPALEAEVNA